MSRSVVFGSGRLTGWTHVSMRAAGGGVEDNGNVRAENVQSGTSEWVK